MITPKGMHRSKMVVAAVAAFLLWGLLLLALALGPAHAAGTCTATAGTTTCTFSPTGAEDTFVVPDGVRSVHVVATGAPGAVGYNGGSAGRGARVSGDLTVDPGQTLYVNVGGAPTGVAPGADCYPLSACIGGFNGGGGAGRYGGGGGGASDVREISRAEAGSLVSRLIVAGGGGGSAFGFDPDCRGGLGGSGGDAGSDGGAGDTCTTVPGGTGGKAGGVSAGGAGGSPSGGNGSLGLGGTGGGQDGGGGGGGLFGGGGGGNFNTGFVASDLVFAPGGGGGGGSNLVPTGGNATIATAGGSSVTISYTEPNTAPTATDDSASTDEDTPLTGNVLANDTDPDGDPLTAVQESAPSHGTLTFNSNGSFVYTPTANYNGLDSFTYKANDGTVDSNTATVNISVTAVDDNPVAVDDTKTVAEDEPATTINVLANDTDADGGRKAIASVTQPTNGTVAITNGGSELTYKPNADYCNGGSPTDNFTYTLNGGSTATVAVTVTCVNDAPVAKDQSVTTDEDTPRDVTLSASDIESNSLTYEIVSGPSHGTLNGTGATRTYTPDADFNGSDSFNYRASDGSLDSETATVSITVEAVDDAPQIAVVAGSASSSACLDNATGRVTLKLSDVDSHRLTLGAQSSNTGLVPDGNISFSGTGDTRTATIRALSGHAGSSTVTITANDGHSGASTRVKVVAGTSAADAFTGTSGNDVILARAGNDAAIGLGGDDLLCGGAGGDALSGGEGNDTLRGGPDGDTLLGGGGADSFGGGMGTDRATDFDVQEDDTKVGIP